MAFEFQNEYILKSISGFYYVKAANGVLECKARGLFRKQGITPLAGDYVKLDREGGLPVVSQVLTRKNALQRPPIANLDKLFIVASTAEPSPNFLVLDKLTAIAENKGIQPFLIVTKPDLGPAEPIRSHFKASGIPVLAMEEGEASLLSALKEEIKGNLCAFTGNSGVGKSTLLNRLAPSLGLATGEISQKLGRGRHTTRQVELYPLFSGLIADTPGFSALEVERAGVILKEDLQYAFPEFAPYIPNCRFTGCAHLKEKGCAVTEALQNGKISAGRYESYAQLYEEAKKWSEWEVRETKK